MKHEAKLSIEDNMPQRQDPLQVLVKNLIFADLKHRTRYDSSTDLHQCLNESVKSVCEQLSNTISQIKRDSIKSY